MATIIIGITSIAFLTKVLMLSKTQEPDKVVKWMMQNNDKSGVDVFII